MARPRLCRRVGGVPGSNYFKPRGIPLSSLEEVVLTVDELEAVRLADLAGLYQEQAAEKMNVSRPTFGRIIASAHKKVAEALVEGKALKIEGGEFEMAAMRKFKCQDCRDSWNCHMEPAGRTAVPPAKARIFIGPRRMEEMLGRAKAGRDDAAAEGGAARRNDPAKTDRARLNNLKKPRIIKKGDQS